MVSNYWSLVKQFYKKYKIRKILLWIAAIFVVLLILFFIFRNPLANYLVHKKAANFGKSHHAELHIGEIKFKGLSGVQVKDIFLKPNEKDTLVRVESAYVRLSLWKLLIFRVSLTDFELQNADMHVVRDTSGNNYSFMLEGGKEEKSDTIEEIEVAGENNFSEKASGLLSLAFDLLPSNIIITNFNIRADLDAYHVGLFLPEFKVEDHVFASSMQITEEKTVRQWKVEGELDPSDEKINCKWFSGDTSKVVIPYLQHKFKTLISFDTIQYELYEESGSSSLTTVVGNAAVSGLVINNVRISLEDVFLNNASITYKINVGEEYIELDSSSNIIFNQLNFHPYISYTAKPHKVFSMHIEKPWFPAQNLISSLPKGLFNNLQGMQVKGDFAYHLKLNIDFNQLDSLVFDSDLQRRDFHVLKYGAADLGKMNGPFMYTAFEHGQAVRTFEVGPGNPNFRALSQIPDYLKNCILYSEDLGFFWHRGFSEGAFRSSMVRNIKSKRFVRGGSTISMQLVKNVFLTRNKTIARKLEEALIVWLIENNRLSSKERMYEVYLNIIEWGPMVYGANEASQFYFAKDISKITLQEAIYLASIIPKPKWFRSSFDGSGNLKPSMDAYYKNISGRMLKNGIITQAEYDALVPNVELKGPAKALILLSDTIEMDSLDIEIL